MSKRQAFAEEEEEEVNFTVSRKVRGSVADVVAYAVGVTPTAEILDAPLDEFNTAVKPPKINAEFPPARAIRVLMHAGGAALLPETHPLYSYTSLPIAPSGSAVMGLTILYNVWKLSKIPNPAAALLAGELFRSYRIMLQSAIPDLMPQSLNSLNKLEVRLQTHYWEQIVTYYRDEEERAKNEIEEEYKKAKEAKTTPPPVKKPEEKKKEITERVTEKMKSFINTTEDVRQFTTAIDWNTWADSFDKLKQLDELKPMLLGSTARLGTTYDRFYEEMFNIMSAAPADLFLLLGGRVDPPVKLGSDPIVYLPEITDSNVKGALDTVIGTASLSQDEETVKGLMNAYKTLAEFIPDQNRYSAYQYIFLFAWLPLHTGIGFNQRFGFFEARQISFNLLGPKGILPLFGTAIRASATTFSLVNELFAFVNFIRGSQDNLWSDDVNLFTRNMPYQVIHNWQTKGSSSKTVAEFQTREFYLLGKLFNVATASGKINPETDLWLAGIVNGVTLAPTRLYNIEPEQRTEEFAHTLYTEASNRVNAPDADSLFQNISMPLETDSPLQENYGELRSPQAATAMQALLSPDQSARELLILIGPALGRLAVMLAYLHQNLTVICVPIMALAKSLETGPRPTGTDWITPIVAEAANLCGDSTLASRVIVSHEATLIDFAHNKSNVRSLLERGDTYQKLFVVCNHYNAALQFDVPEALFIKMANKFLSHKDLENCVIYSTTQLNDTMKSVSIGATASPIMPLLQARNLQATGMYLNGGAGEYPQFYKMVAAAKSSDMLLHLFGSDEGPAGIYTVIEDAHNDLKAMEALESSLSSRPLTEQAKIRLNLLVAIANRFHIEGYIPGPPPNLVNKIAMDVAQVVLSGKNSALLSAIKTARSRVTVPRFEAVAVEFPPDTINFSGIERLELVSSPLGQLKGHPDCIEKLTAWRTALTALVDMALTDYQKSHFAEKYVWRAATTNLNHAVAQLRKAWPALSSCLARLVEHGEKAEATTNWILSLGPALIYAQMIQDTLYQAQAAVSAVHLDMRPSRAVGLRLQEEPFLQWYGLINRTPIDIVARLSALLFTRSNWMVPFALGVLSDTTRNDRMSLVSVCNMAAHRCAALILSEDEFRTIKPQGIQPQLRRFSRVRKQTSSADSPLEKKEPTQFKRYIDAFIMITTVFRSSVDNRQTPTAFFLNSRPVHRLALDVEEDQIQELIIAYINRAREQISSRDADIESRAYKLIDRFSSLLVEVAYSYINGGIDGLVRALKLGPKIRTTSSAIENTAFRFEPLWRLPLLFKDNSENIDFLFKDGEMKARDLPAHLQALKVSRKYRHVDTRLNIYLGLEEIVGKDAKIAEELYITLVPNEGQGALNNAQRTFVQRYFAFVEFSKYKASRDKTAEYRNILAQVQSLDTSNAAATLETSDNVYTFLVGTTAGRESWDKGKLKQLTAAVDDKLLLGKLAREFYSEELPAFVKKQLGTITLNEAIEMNLYNEDSQTETLLRSFLKTVYTDLLAGRNVKMWRDWLLDPLPAYDQIYIAEDIHLSGKYLAHIYKETVPDENRVAYTKKELSNPFVQNLVDALYVDAHTKEEKKSADEELYKIETEQTSEHERRVELDAIVWFSRLEQSEGERIWANVTKARNETLDLDACDLYPPWDRNIILDWVEDSLGLETPHRDKLLKHPKQPAEGKEQSEGTLVAYAPLIRFWNYAEPAQIDALKAELTRLQTAIEKIHEIPASKQHITTADGLLSDADVKAATNDYIQEQFDLSVAHRRLWLTAVQRLRDTIASPAGLETVAAWFRARASSWQQRLMTLHPDLDTTNSEWEWILSMHIPTVLPEGSELRTESAFIQSLTRINIPSITEKQTHEQLFHTALAMITGMALDRLIGDVGKSIPLDFLSNTLRNKMLTDRLAAMKKQEEEGAGKKEGKESAQSMQATGLTKKTEIETKLGREITAAKLERRMLELLVGHFQPPTIDYPGSVLTAYAADYLEKRLKPEYGADKSALLARLLTWYTRHVQFIEQTRYFAPSELHIGASTDKPTMDVFVTKVLEAAPTDVPKLFRDRLLMDSMLYGSLDSVKKLKV